ncbi:MAG: SEC-C motif domain protein [Desulfotomaculum sp. 46_296]|nr:MAG: SEC-C motif domain protein [Desulfotomaculum sp. 46_296]HAU31911.1 hypothetical protein [Desulfotomaculum sp.]
MKKKDKETCPCGCGRLAKVVSIEQFGFRRTGQQLRRKLGTFADQPFLAREVTRAQKIYLDKINNEMIDRFDEFILERCFEWLIFDYILMTGETIIEMFQRNPDLTRQEQQLLREWAQSRISLYEVESISSKNCLTLHDLIGRKRMTVYDLNAAQELDRGMVLLMRVLKVGDEYEFSTSGLALPAACKDLLLERIKNDLELYCSKKNIPVLDEGINTYLKDNACLLNSWVIEMNLNYPASFTIDEESDKGIQEPEKESFSSEIAREITNVLFDEYYDRWINCPISALNGLTPKQACRSSEGRKFLKEMLHELEQVEIERECNGEPSYDFRKVWQKLGLAREKPNKCGATLYLVKNESDTVNLYHNPGNYQWPYPNYAQVALKVLEDLTTRGCSRNQLNSALRLWHDFCWTERPAIRKSNVWVATIIYAMARLELDRKVNRQKLAERYGIAPSTISSNFRKLCLTLELPDFDNHYSTHKPAIPDLNVDYSLLARIWKNIKI